MRRRYGIKSKNIRKLFDVSFSFVADRGVASVLYDPLFQNPLSQDGLEFDEAICGEALLLIRIVFEEALDFILRWRPGDDHTAHFRRLRPRAEQPAAIVAGLQEAPVFWDCFTHAFKRNRECDLDNEVLHVSPWGLFYKKSDGGSLLERIDGFKNMLASAKWPEERPVGGTRSDDFTIYFPNDVALHITTNCLEFE